MTVKKNAIPTYQRAQARNGRLKKISTKADLCAFFGLKRNADLRNLPEMILAVGLMDSIKVRQRDGRVTVKSWGAPGVEIDVAFDVD